ncbi:MBL fold metallo-hydrolase RNA specificity domain-containing protein [Dokdonella fugitiva]|uniref:MBL fold metallo-hydrolase RNA specificity domain-containing protein n=1 Tax=Dokdonella fugitiva TaxID=328517 RepID=UPI0015F8E88D|nr:MBL fold metallo-hydrolase [Dokdonella fugitiva]MBA8885660.1 metallo-beta-lactamase family protein [Dokdonella fugitiva]
MQIEFHGAAGGEVTGSCHLVEAAGHRVLLDCGMIQGSREAEARNLAPFDFDAASIDALVLSHAHIDHIGRVPLLVKRGFRGPIWAQRATCDLLPIMLLDAASLAEQAAERANNDRARGEPEIRPLYTREDVEATRKRLRPLPYHAWQTILPGVTLRLHDAGHILGSSIVELREEGAAPRTLVFSGDVGMRGTPILRDPEAPPAADLLLMESTYGDRDHKERLATVAELGSIFDEAREDGGNVVIPAFAVGRSQELLYWFAAHYEDWNLERWRIFLDSPMAAKVMGVYHRHEELFDAEAAKVWRGRLRPFALPNLRVAETVEDSKAINRLHGGAIIVAGSGMANGGRVRHHLANNLARRGAHVVFVGYQAHGTLGRLLVDGVRRVRLFGDDIEVRARIHTVGGLSAHADQHGLLEWYGAGASRPPVVLVHGEDPARSVLASELHRRHGIEVTLSRPGMRRAI